MTLARMVMKPVVVRTASRWPWRRRRVFEGRVLSIESHDDARSSVSVTIVDRSYLDRWAS